MRRKLSDQTPSVEKLFAQLKPGEVLFIGYVHGNNPHAGKFLYEQNQKQLEVHMASARGNAITFYAQRAEVA